MYYPRHGVLMKVVFSFMTRATVHLHPALQMQPSATQKVSESIAQGLTSGAVAASKRLTAFEELWPSVFKEVVCECADQMADMNHFMREGMRTLLA